MTIETSVREDGKLETLCPVCASDKTRTIQKSLEKDLFRCKMCGLYFFNPLPPEQSVEQFFSDSYITDEQRLEEFFTDNRDRIFMRVSDEIFKRKSNGRILDVGCAGGYFLAKFFEPKDWDRWGVDLSPFLTKNAASQGITVRTGQIEKVDLPASAFDVIVLQDVAYYFRDPITKLSNLARLLAPGGIIVVTFTLAQIRVFKLANRVGRVLLRSKRSIMDADHLMFYTTAAAMQLFGRAGFETLQITGLPGQQNHQPIWDLIARAYDRLTQVMAYLTKNKVIANQRFMLIGTPRKS